MSTLASMIHAAHADIDEIAAWLDSLDHATRVRESQSLGPKTQRRLWELARGRGVTLDQIVPRDRAPLETVRHHGRNTLPAFRLFEKRFCRPARGHDQSVLWGYNEGSSRPLVGPGYFVCRETGGDSRGDVVVDYYQVPGDRPAAWPAVVDNETGLQRFVFAYMHDFLRRVSEHVTIGRAYRLDRETPNCFTLCREP